MAPNGWVCAQWGGACETGGERALKFRCSCTRNLQVLEFLLLVLECYQSYASMTSDSIFLGQNDLKGLELLGNLAGSWRLLELIRNSNLRL